MLNKLKDMYKIYKKLGSDVSVKSSEVSKETGISQELLESVLCDISKSKFAKYLDLYEIDGTRCGYEFKNRKVVWDKLIEAIEPKTPKKAIINDATPVEEQIKILPEKSEFQMDADDILKHFDSTLANLDIETIEEILKKVFIYKTRVNCTYKVNSQDNVLGYADFGPLLVEKVWDNVKNAEIFVLNTNSPKKDTPDDLGILSAFRLKLLSIAKIRKNLNHLTALDIRRRLTLRYSQPSEYAVQKTLNNLRGNKFEVDGKIRVINVIDENGKEITVLNNDIENDRVLAKFCEENFPQNKLKIQQIEAFQEEPIIENEKKVSESRNNNLPKKTEDQLTPAQIEKLHLIKRSPLLIREKMKELFSSDENNIENETIIKKVISGRNICLVLDRKYSKEFIKFFGTWNEEKKNNAYRKKEEHLSSLEIAKSHLVKGGVELIRAAIKKLYNSDENKVGNDTIVKKVVLWRKPGLVLDTNFSDEFTKFFNDWKKQNAPIFKKLRKNKEEVFVKNEEPLVPEIVKTEVAVSVPDTIVCKNRDNCPVSNKTDALCAYCLSAFILNSLKDSSNKLNSEKSGLIEELRNTDDVKKEEEINDNLSKNREARQQNLADQNSLEKQIREINEVLENKFKTLKEIVSRNFEK